MTYSELHEHYIELKEELESLKIYAEDLRQHRNETSRKHMLAEAEIKRLTGSLPDMGLYKVKISSGDRPSNL